MLCWFERPIHNILGFDGLPFNQQCCNGEFSTTQSLQSMVCWECAEDRECRFRVTDVG
jgi:hypothetical protein